MPPSHPSPSFQQLISACNWQTIQDNFAQVIAIGIKTIDAAGKAVTSASGQPRLCTELLTQLNQDYCMCLPTFLGGKAIIDKNLSYHCIEPKLNLCNFIIPLELTEHNVAGYIAVGPVILVMRKPREEYRRVAEELNLNIEALWEGLLEIKVASFHGIKSLLTLLKDVGEYTIRNAYEKLSATRLKAPGHATSDIDHLSETLLDVAFEMTKADIGSVMFFDEQDDELTVRASRGLPDNVARFTRLKRGQPICGIAAVEGKPLLIDEHTTDNRIKPYLNRPHLSSSMVLPVRIKNQVKGVMNLGVLRSSLITFNDGNIKLLEKLIDLATVAWQ